jgi:hypothetical protein
MYEADSSTCPGSDQASCTFVPFDRKSQMRQSRADAGRSEAPRMRGSVFKCCQLGNQQIKASWEPCPGNTSPNCVEIQSRSQDGRPMCVNSKSC